MGTKTAVSVPKGQFQGATCTEYGSPIVLCRKLAIFQSAGQSVGFRRAGVCRCIILRQQVSDNQWLYSCEGGENHPPSRGKLVDSQLVVGAILGQEEDCV